MELKECECGCGELIAPINTKGNIARFVSGHNFKGKNNPHWIGGEYISNKGYIKIQIPDHPYRDSHGHVFKHRWIYEQYLGRYLRPEEHIHHKDNNKLNNDLSNLELTDRSKHSKITAKTNPKCQKIDMNGRKCLVCDTSNPSPNGNGRPHWLLHPITRQKFVCVCCYRRIKRNNSN